MPKEAVYSTLDFLFDEKGEPIDVSDDERAIAEVRWSRETGDVQVVTRRKGYEIAGPNDRDPIPCDYGLYIDLDRRGINDMIRYLRRARDQAFGRDE